jgi:hypothetical protein
MTRAGGVAVHVWIKTSLGFNLTTSSTAGVAMSETTAPTTYFVGDMVTSAFLLQAVNAKASGIPSVSKTLRMSIISLCLISADASEIWASYMAIALKIKAMLTDMANWLAYQKPNAKFSGAGAKRRVPTAKLLASAAT